MSSSQAESSETSHRRSTEDEIKSPRPLGADILSSQRSSAEQRLDWDKYENQVPSVEENRPTSEVTTASSTLDNTTDEMAGKTEVYRDANIENKANWPVDDNEELDAKRASSSPNPEPLNSDATEEDEDLKSPKEVSDVLPFLLHEKRLIKAFVKPSERRDLAPELAHTSNKCESPELGRTTRITSPIPENQISRTNDEDGESRRRESQPAPSQTKRRREKGDQGISEEEQNAIRERTRKRALKQVQITTP